MTARKTQDITHYIITNRLVTDADGKGFMPANKKEYIRWDGKDEARDALRYGKIIFPKGNLKDFEIDLTREGTKLGSEKLFEDLHGQGSKADQQSSKEHILFYIHGFNCDLKKAVKIVHELHQKYVLNEKSPIRHIVLFSWPALDNKLKYRDDKRDAQKSGYAVARALSNLRELFRNYFVEQRVPICNQKIHLMAHSMGCFVLKSMLEELNHMEGAQSNVFGEIVLVGADVDYDALEAPKPMSDLIDLGERVHVYYHNGDVALGISETTKNSFNRLGRWGAKNSISLPDDVYQSDVSAIDDERGLDDQLIHHWYYLSSEEVVNDINEVLAGEVSVFSEEFLS